MAIELQNEKAFQKQFGVFVGKQRLLGKGDEKEIRYFKDIGLGYKTPKAAIEGTYVDHKCPFTSSVSIRGRILTGIVKSTKMQRTVIVRRDYLHFIPKYSRYEKRHRNIPAHCSPCFNVKEGDRVVIGQCRPLSKTVRFNVIKVVDTKKKKVSTRKARRIAQIRKGIARGTYTRKRVVKATKAQKPGAKKAKKVVKKSAPVLDQEKLMKKVQKKLNKSEKKEEKAKDTKKGAKGKQPAKGKKQAPAKKVAAKPVKKEEKPVAKKQEAKKQTPAKKEQPKKQAPAKKEQPKKAEPKKAAPAKKEQPKKAEPKKTAPAKKEQPKKQAQPKKTQPKANASKKATKK